MTVTNGPALVVRFRSSDTTEAASILTDLDQIVRDRLEYHGLDPEDSMITLIE